MCLSNIFHKTRQPGNSGHRGFATEMEQKDQWEPGGVDMEGQDLPKDMGTTGSTLIEDTGPRVDQNRMIRGSARDRRPIQ